MRHRATHMAHFYALNKQFRNFMNMKSQTYVEAKKMIQNIIHIPHFQELQEGAAKDSSVVVIEGKIVCQNAIRQFSHRLADPELAQGKV